MPTPYYDAHGVTVHQGDCLNVLRALPDATVDAVCTDPPYGLEFMGKDWDRPWAVGMSRPGYGDAERMERPAFGDSRNANCRACGGRQRGANRCACAEPQWDRHPREDMRAYGAWCEGWAAECLRVLKPGGHLLAFGGTRTWHRLTCAIEDAGFEIRDTITWLYGSGFPKSLDVGKAIDKRPGVGRHREFATHLAERRQVAGLSRSDVSERVVGTRTGACWNWEHHQFPEAKWWPALRDLLGLDEGTWGPVIAEAERERIGTRTTGKGTGHGAVAYIADGENDAITAPATDEAARWQGWGTALKPASEPIVVARKPLTGTVAATVIAHGTGALNIDGCRVDSEGPHGTRGRNKFADFDQSGRTVYNKGAGSLKSPENPAGRWPANVVLTHAPDCEHEDDGGCVEGCPIAELDAQSGTLASGANPTRRGTDKLRDAYGDFKGQEDCTPARGADTGGASRFFPTFRYEAKADTAQRPRAGDIAHPTVKPLALMRWLVRLVTPPGGLVLDPFAGSGTTAEACIVEGFRCITIEREADYLPLIVHRITRRTDPVAHLTAQAQRGEDVDLGLFGLLGDLGGVA